MFTRSAGFLLTENLYICAIKHTSNHNMKKFNLIAVLTILSVSYLSAQSSILESQSMPSKLMKKDIRYSVYLPDGYHTSGQKYPVLYLLHGYTDDETGWTQFGNVRRIADEAIATGKSAEMIIVMPDAWDTWYLNSFDNQEPYENMFFEELIPFIESTYRARTTREHRAIAGLSMGGYGALVYALHHPDMFSTCSALSAAVRTDEQMKAYDNDAQERKRLFSRIYGNGITTEHWKQNSVFSLIDSIDEKQTPQVSFYIDCGDDDYLFPNNLILFKKIREKKLTAELRVRNGGHAWHYWREALPEVMEFSSNKFLRK